MADNTSTIIFSDTNKAHKVCDLLNGEEVKSTKPRKIKDFIVPESKTWYELATNQVTIPLDARLSNAGLKEKERIYQRLVNEQPKQIFSNAILEPLSAGLWISDPDSPWHTDDQPTILNAMVNLRIRAIISNDTITVTTSRLMWRGVFTDGTNWGVTETGSLYYWT